MKSATVTYIIDKEANTTLMAYQQFKVVGLKGYGGKIEPGQTWQESAVLEIGQETGKDKALRVNPEQDGGITVKPEDLEPVALIDFYNGNETEVPPGDPSFRVLCCRCFHYEGTAIDTIEMMRPAWYRIDDLPFQEMIKGDIHIVPNILAGIFTKGHIRRTSDWSTILDYHFEACDPSELTI